MTPTPTPATPPGLQRLNAMPPAEATATLMACCGSRRWSDAMINRRPFPTLEALLCAADEEWRGLGRDDWLEAFSHHPRIGEVNLSQKRFESTAAQAGREQSGMRGATDAARQSFASGNAEYERRFGHVFLICASGKSGEFMLDQLRSRLGNDAPTELTNAATEQGTIMRLRLERLVGE